ncbi:uncharacterized protein LOC109911229 [Rhincodon typus]|uniref:uncharacterized protein LOC109911229 n=1 Tax=Rhincodon typus TaxID=259920 RepID=UPI002030A0D7|nr:uncharacterized protein LOC109911229 [Rhincodon typus]
MAFKKKSRNLAPLDSNVILGTISPANQYLVRLIEDKKELSFKKPTEERMNLVFQVLDDLLPQMGIFTRILKLRDELYAGIYSTKITGSSALESRMAAAITRAPYFSLFHQLQEKRNEKAQDVCTELKNLREILLQKEQDQIDLQQSVAELKESNKVLEDHITFLNETVHEKTEAAKRLRQDYRVLQEEVAKQTRYCEETITDLKAMLQITKAEVASLNQYKKIYEELQEGFQYPIEIKKKIAFATTFRKSPENRKTAQTTSKFAGKQKIFQQSMAQIVTELALVNQHEESLQKQLDEQEKYLLQERQEEEKSVKSAPHTTQASVSKVTSGSSGLGRGSSSSVLSGLENYMDESPEEIFSDTFSANEIVLNKYSAMISTSCNGGNSYVEVKEATMCLSCAEKTLICPHKIGNNCVIALPKNCTHIKISRPKAHIITMEAKLPRAREHVTVTAYDTVTATVPEPCAVSQFLLDSSSTVSVDQCNKSKNDTAQLPSAPGACKLQSPQAGSSWQREEKNALICCLHGSCNLLMLPKQSMNHASFLKFSLAN